MQLFSAEESDSDDDLILPDGPAPGTNGAESDESTGSEDSDDEEDDDIPMPEGPPPPKPLTANSKHTLFHVGMSR